jgi:hypothetical protein
MHVLTVNKNEKFLSQGKKWAHCTEKPNYIFPEMKLCSLVPISYMHVSVSDFIYSQDRSAYLAAAK